MKLTDWNKEDLLIEHAVEKIKKYLMTKDSWFSLDVSEWEVSNEPKPGWILYNWNPHTEPDCYYFVIPHDVRKVLLNCSSRVIIISKQDNAILFDGSANDEG